MTTTWTTAPDSAAATAALGRALGRAAVGGEVVALIGALGAGKTCFSQGVGAGLGVVGPITSPTFVLINEYAGRLPLLHADLYRVHGRDLLGIGLEEALEGWPGVALVEWADLHPHVLPADHLRLTIGCVPTAQAAAGATGQARIVGVRAHGPRSRVWLSAWRALAEVGDAD